MCKFLIERQNFTAAECAKLFNVNRMTVIRRINGLAQENNRGQVRARKVQRDRARRLGRVKRAYDERNKAGKRRHPSIRSLSRVLGAGFSKSNVQRMLAQGGVHFATKIKGPSHTREQVGARLSFSKRHIESDEKFVFVDEAWVDINGQGGGFYVWPDEEINPADLVDVHDLHPTKILIFAAIGHNFRFVKVLPVRQRTDDEDGWRLNAERYKRICLQPLVPHLVATNSILVQDGASVHRAKKVLRYLASKGVRTLDDWPAKSPDLNPIENLWSILKRKIAQQGPRTLTGLIETTVKTFESEDDVPSEMVNNLVGSFRERLQRCVRAKGFLTTSSRQKSLGPR